MKTIFDFFQKTLKDNNRINELSLKYLGEKKFLISYVSGHVIYQNTISFDEIAKHIFGMNDIQLNVDECYRIQHVIDNKKTTLHVAQDYSEMGTNKRLHTPNIEPIIKEHLSYKDGFEILLTAIQQTMKRKKGTYKRNSNGFYYNKLCFNLNYQDSFIEILDTDIKETFSCDSQGKAIFDSYLISNVLSFIDCKDKTARINLLYPVYRNRTTNCKNNYASLVVQDNDLLVIVMGMNVERDKE